MSSVITNKGAMVALETLRGINNNLADVQSQISTGKKISTSTDNAAIWSIATVMESDVKSFDQVSDSLNLGSATVGVARSAADQVTGLLQEAKSLIVAANDPSVSDEDRAKYQTDITELTGTIGSIVDAASFNGQNLLKGTGNIEVLSSLNRQDDGTVSAGRIAVGRNDLSTAAANLTAISSGALSVATSGTNVTENGGTATLTITAGTTSEDATVYSLTVGGTAVEYTAAAGLDQDALAAGLSDAINTALDDDSSAIANTLTATASGNVVTLTNTAAANSNANDVTITNATAQQGTADGGLVGLSTLSVATTTDAAAALTAIDGLLQTAIDATAEFGSKQKRIDNQNEFISTLSDSLKTGIGAMTDANLEEASARLQSLQVQQQLGVQALSIANQAPQSLLSLFR